MTLTKEEIKRAGELAERGRIVPSGWFIQAMRSANKGIENYVPNVKRIGAKARERQDDKFEALKQKED